MHRNAHPAGSSEAPPALASSAGRPLASGHTEWLQLPRGARIILLHGRLRLHEPPWWLAETLWQPVRWLDAGETCTLERAGWVRLEAGAACRVLVQAPAGGAERLLRPLTQLIKWAAAGARRLACHRLIERARIADNS